MTAQSNITPESIVGDLRYLQLLSRSFPTIADASTEIINLEAILNLPKGTEHFLTDIHGEYEAFQHVLKNASGAVKRKVNEIFGNTLREAEKKELCTLIYYPEEKLQLVKAREKDLDDWYLITLNQLVKVCQNVSSKYTRSKVRKSLPAEFSYIIQELLHESSIEPNKHAYINVIISTIITTKRADDFIIAMCNLIQRLTIDSLHIVGDIYDRGPGAHIIMDTLCNYHNFDIQWGNHDILWMGAASGNDSCIANVIRMSMRYGNLGTLEDGYGINLLPLATFAMDTYADDPCTIFMPKMNFADAHYNEKTLRLITQMHKAITIIQFKLEAEIIDRRPEFGMANRKLLEKIDFDRGVFVYEGKEYVLRDTNFPTVDPANPYRLTEEERELVEKIHYSFMNSEKLKKHMRCLFTYGGMYLVSNSNLLYHASVPLNEDGSFKRVKIRGKEYWGRRLLDKADQLIRTAYFDEEGEEDKEFAMDYIWYMWCGPEAPLFDKDKMATFERYFLEDKEIQKEKKGYYYSAKPDILRETTRGYGNTEKPEDYLEAFAKFVNENKDKIEAIRIACTKPSDMTRAQLKELKLTLDKKNFTETNLNEATSSVTNVHIVADIIAYVRQAVLKTPIFNHDERVTAAFDKLTATHHFNKIQLDLLNKIKTYMLHESILNTETFEAPVFKMDGGFDRFNKKFGGTLVEIIREINTYIYEGVA